MVLAEHFVTVSELSIQSVVPAEAGEVRPEIVRRLVAVVLMVTPFVFEGVKVD